MTLRISPTCRVTLMPFVMQKSIEFIRSFVSKSFLKTSRIVTNGFLKSDVRTSVLPFLSLQSYHLPKLLQERLPTKESFQLIRRHTNHQPENVGALHHDLKLK